MSFSLPYFHQEDAEQSIFVPSIVEVSAPPASPPSGDKELHFAYMEPDLIQQDSKNLKNKWRSISENQILKVRISGGQKGSLCKIFKITYSLFCSMINHLKKIIYMQILINGYLLNYRPLQHSQVKKNIYS